LVVDGDGPDRRGAQAAGYGGLFDRVVPVDAGEENEGAGRAGVARGLALGVEGVAGDDDGGQVGGAAALAGDAAGAGASEAEEVGEGAGGVFFDDGEGGRDLVDVDLGDVSCGPVA